MKQAFCSMLVLVCGMIAHADIAFEVKDVEAHPRYPWNGKVDIDFTIDSAAEGSNFAVRVSALDTVGKTNVALKTLRYDDKIALVNLEKFPAGNHRVTWDADTDVPGVLFSSLSFSVSAWAVGETVIPENGLYMVIDLSGACLISYLSAAPKGGGDGRIQNDETCSASDFGREGSVGTVHSYERFLCGHFRGDTKAMAVFDGGLQLCLGDVSCLCLL